MHWMPNASNYRSLSLKSAYTHHEDAKKHKYGHRVRDIEHGVSPHWFLVTSTGGMGCEATVFYRRLADLLAGQEYSQTIRLSFALRTSMCHHVHPQKQVILHIILCLGHWTYQWSLLRAGWLINIASIILLLFSFFIEWFYNYFTIILALVTNDDCDFWCDCYTLNDDSYVCRSLIICS